MADLRIFVKTLAKEAEQGTVKSACDKLKGYFNDVCKEAIKSSSGNRKGFTQSTVRVEPSVSEVDFKRGDVLVYITKSDKSLLAMATSQTRNQEAGGVTGTIKGAVLCEVFWDKVPPIQKQSDWDMPATVLANLMFHELGHNKCTMGVLVQTGNNEFQNKPVDMHATGGAILSAKHEIGQLMKARPDAKDIRCLSQVLDNIVPQYTYYLSANSRIL